MPDIDNIKARFKKALDARAPIEREWDDCLSYALPGAAAGANTNGKALPLYDSTAQNAVHNLASSLLSQLTPPWSRWFGLSLGADSAKGDGELEAMERAEKILASHMDRSNFYTEAHQCYLDLVTLGTAVILFEEAPVGAASAFRFSAVPMTEIALEEVGGRIEGIFRRSFSTLEELSERFKIAVPEDKGGEKAALVEAVIPRRTSTGAQGYDYVAFVEDNDKLLGEDTKILKTGVFAASPFIAFRWLKVPGETYGRSPVMKALPDIKTANKVVELILKNASISVAGIWQADDDGVLNPENIVLAPGTIIPKAVGSSGLTPLRPGADFDVSQIVLSELRASINHSLLADQLSATPRAGLTATEILERATQISRVLGATYGRLQSEFLTPVILRAVSILKRRGELSDIMIDGHEADLRYQSPLATAQAMRDADNVIEWVRIVAELGEEGFAIVDKQAVAQFLGRALGVPGSVTRTGHVGE